MRSIERRDTGESYEAFVRSLAEASGVETPTRADLARFDRSRKNKKTSNKEWKSPQDPDAKIAKMKDGRTHLAHKAEHGVDMDTGAIVSVTVQDASAGDSATLPETLLMAAEQVELVQPDGGGGRRGGRRQGLPQRRDAGCARRGRGSESRIGAGARPALLAGQEDGRDAAGEACCAEGFVCEPPACARASGCHATGKTAPLATLKTDPPWPGRSQTDESMRGCRPVGREATGRDDEIRRGGGDAASARARLGVEAHSEGVRVQQEHGAALRGGRRLDGLQPAGPRRQARGSGGMVEGVLLSAPRQCGGGAPGPAAGAVDRREPAHGRARGRAVPAAADGRGEGDGAVRNGPGASVADRLRGAAGAGRGRAGARVPVRGDAGLYRGVVMSRRSGTSGNRRGSAAWKARSGTLAA